MSLTEIAMLRQADQYYAHRMYYEGIFEKNEDMSYIFQWLLGQEANYGSATGELFYAASQIEDGDLKSWSKVFGELAQRVEARAEASLAKGHMVSAREGFLRASNYYRVRAVKAEAFNADHYVNLLTKSRSVFHKACPLFDPPIEPTNFPYEGKSLPGYFWKAADDGKKRKTLVMIGGGETVTEDMFFYLGPHAVRRGYNFATADLPGQGITPVDGFVFRPDGEVPIGAILDHILERDDVDADRVAAAGQSYGGYFVPRAACYDKRIKACIGNAVIFHLPGIIGQYFDDLETNKARRDNPMSRWKWKWNVETPAEFRARQEELTYDPSQLTCPTLSIVGEGEYQNNLMQEQTKTAIERSPNEHSKAVIPPLDEGGAHHCTWENTYLAAQITFDWLDELFD